MAGFMRVRVEDVEHGCCVMLQHVTKVGLKQEVGGRLAMIDSGSSADFKPSTAIKAMGRDKLDYLFITNADQDHMSDLKGLKDAGIEVVTLLRNPTYTGEEMRRIKLVSGPLSNDAMWYVNALSTYTDNVTAPFNTSMSGITYKAFYNLYGSGYVSSPGCFSTRLANNSGFSLRHFCSA